MNRIRHINRQGFALFVCSGMMIALIYSKFALTVGMILLILSALFNFRKEEKFHWYINPALTKNWRNFFQRKDFLAITLFFLIVFVSGLYSSDLGYWSERLRIKLPFLLLPFAFVSIPAFTKKQYHSLFYFFLWTMTLSTIPVLIHYLLNFDAITESLGRGKAIPTPINHIRYSLFLSFAMLSGALLWGKKFYVRYPWERHLMLGLVLYLFCFLHLLSVRSGLLVLYTAMLFLGLRYMIYSRRYLLGIALVLSLAATPFLAYLTIPSLQKKIQYTLYDLDQYRQGNITNLSDAERFISIESGLKVGHQHPVLGVGAGDLKAAIKIHYQTHHPQISSPKMPHNQLVSVYAGMGVIGLIFFLFAFFYPFVYPANLNDPFLFSLGIIMFCSFFVENTIENAIGVAFYALFLLIGLNQRLQQNI